MKAIATEKAARYNSIVSSLDLLAIPVVAKIDAAILGSNFVDASISMKPRNLKNGKYDRKVP